MSEKTSTSSETDAQQDSFVPTIGKYFPESLGAALFLAVLAFAVTIPQLETTTQLELFSTGFFQLFTVQMLLILFWVLGASVVESPYVGRLLDAIAEILPTSQSGVIYTTAVLSLALGWINWAFGLIGGILIGQRLCRRAQLNGSAVHYPLVLVGGLLALVLMNQGISSPGGLMMADESGLANFMVEETGSITMAEFVFHPANLVSSIVITLTLPLFLVFLAPDDESEIEPLNERDEILEGTIAETLDHYSSDLPREEWEIGDRLENSLVITLIAVVLGLASVVWHFGGGGALTLPWLMFTLVILGLAVQGPPMAFRAKTEDATRWANHVAIPFLLYAAVFALLSEADLYGTIGDGITSIGLPYVGSYVVAAVLGLLVPDPGSLWVIQGPALAAANIDLVPSLVSVMYGAGISNLWLSFLFVSLLGIYGFDWREFVRYAAIITAYVTVVVVVLLFVF